MSEDEDLVAVAMLPSYERLMWIHRQLSSGKSLLSVEQLVKNLQDDFERRNAALGRALHLLRTVWDESSHGTEVVAREANFANHWNDVLRWVNGEEKDTVSEEEAKALARAYVDSGQDIYEFCKGLEPAQVAAIKKLIREGPEPITDYVRVSGLDTHSNWLSTDAKTVDGKWTFNHSRREYVKTNDWDPTAAQERWQSMVDRYAGSMSDMDWREMDESNRWNGFSDEELAELRRGVLERHDGSKAVPAEYRERAGRLATELRKEVKRREAEKPSYRGPGRYRHHSGDVVEVLGKTFAGAKYEKVILRRPTDEPGQLLAEMLTDFEASSSGQRRYTYLGPLEDAQMTTPVEIKVVDAGQGWAVLEGIDGHHHRLAVGDSITVPTLVFS